LLVSIFLFKNLYLFFLEKLQKLFCP
jgi:hypothetical protein